MTEALEAAVAKLGKDVEGMRDVLTAIPAAIADGIAKALESKAAPEAEKVPEPEAQKIEPPEPEKLPEPIDEKPPKREHALNKKLW